MLCGALLENAEKLINRGIHPARISEGFELASDMCVKHLETIAGTLAKEM